MKATRPLRRIQSGDAPPDKAKVPKSERCGIASVFARLRKRKAVRLIFVCFHWRSVWSPIRHIMLTRISYTLYLSDST